MLTAIINSMIGDYTAPNEHINQKILTYKSNYLYSNQYKTCVRNGLYTTYIFDEPMSCITENAIQGMMTYYGIQSTYSDLPDNIHILKEYAGGDVGVETISNKEGQVMLLAINITANEAESHVETLRIVDKLASRLGSSVAYPTAESPDIPFSWITSDNYDVSVSKSKNGVLIRYVNRDAYSIFTQNHISIPTI